MFKQKFEYTNKIVKLLTRISAARETILNSPLIPKWNITLRQEAVIHSAHSSTSIEGNRLSLKQVSELAQGREITATRRDKQEVLNYLDVLNNIKNLIKDNFISEKDILNIHRMVTKNTLDNPTDSGVYRNRYVVVGNRFTGEIFFKPPQNREVPGLVKDLVSWINSEESKELDPVIEAGAIHYELVRIHPFVDGNGRTARVLAALILYSRGFDTNQFFCLDDYYDSDRSAYYKALQSVEPDKLDLTNWLEYFTEGVNISIEAVKERILKLSSKRLRKAKGKQIALTERQMRIIEFINQNGKITNKDVREMFNLSNRAALDEINKLLELQVLKSQSKGRALHYIML
ncbi:MAG: Fic family protein [Candidatus Lokiarchaeota archaeon]|nr:Fic family protein [Candidatus Lokiarchaeota archaeon]